ncbi:hypothetical protein GCM10009678_59780 [Actinomadura kijaniata]
MVALLPPERAVSPALPVAAPPHARVAPVVPGCLGYNGLDRLNPPAQVRAGRFAVPGAAPVTVARGGRVDRGVDWALAPGGDRTWQLWLHSLEWLGGLVRAYERTGDLGALDLAGVVVRDWLAANRRPARFDARRREAIEEGTRFRLITMVCLRAHLAAGRLDGAIAEHAR